MADIIEEKVKQLYINQLTKEEFFDLSSESSEYIEIRPNKVYLKGYQIYLIPDDTDEQIDKINDRLALIESDLYSSEGLIQDIIDAFEALNINVDNLYDTALISHESSEELDPSYDGFIIYCGTSTEVMGHEKDDWV